MDKILHDPKDPKLWELWYIPYYGSCRILSINRMSHDHPSRPQEAAPEPVSRELLGRWDQKLSLD